VEPRRKGTKSEYNSRTRSVLFLKAFFLKKKATKNTPSGVFFEGVIQRFSA
jgi:hypothetical protein